MKPRIFIGSSSEGYSIAEIVSDSLDDVAECIRWKNIFELNKSNYENLSDQIALFDYAILIATAEDVTISRKRKLASPRDNILFEFGLFAGGLGRSKVFYMVEKDSKIPSDLYGISLPSFSKKGTRNHHASIERASKEIKKQIIDKENTFELNLIPSTAIAYGYFINFVERTVERLLEDKQKGKMFSLENKTKFRINELLFTVLIPNNLDDDMFKKVRSKRLKGGWKKLKVTPKDVRDYDFSIDVSKVEQGILHLVDIPLTLNALNKSIELYAQKSHLGKDTKEDLLERREIKNFKEVLEYLVARSSLTKDIVKVELVDI